MNAAAILGLGKDLGQRFTLVNLLPNALLGVFLLVLVWGGAPADSPNVDRFIARAENLGIVEAVLLALALLGFALVTQPLQLVVVRLMEGYWGTTFALGLLANWGRRRHTRLRNRLERRQLSIGTSNEAVSQADRSYAAWALSHHYPPALLIMPTRLGNALRAAEDRAGQRYGLETIVAWPRLYPLLSERVASLIEDQRIQMDMAARFTANLLVATAASAALLLPHGWWLLVPAVTLTLSWLSYRGTCSAAIAYGEGLETAFDLHRLDLRVSLHLVLPRTLEDERTLNKELSKFLLQPFAGRQLTYQHQAAPPVRGGSPPLASSEEPPEAAQPASEDQRHVAPGARAGSLSQPTRDPPGV